MTVWLIAAACWCAAAAWTADRDHRRLNGGPAPRPRRPGWMLFAAVGARARRILPPPVVARLPVTDERVLAAAGLTAAVDPAAGGDLRLGGLAVFGGAGLAAFLLVPSPLVALAWLGLIGFGWRYPDVWLAARASRRRERIERGAPVLLDLVAATVAAGVPVEAALSGCAVAVGGPLAEEIALTTAHLALGRPRSEEFRDLAERAGSPSLSALALALRLSDRLGVPLADTLRQQATRTRTYRSQMMQERAAKAGPKVLAVVVFVLVPAALVPVLTAVALTAAGAAGTFGV